MKTLVAGHFSIEGGLATAGDLIAQELACEWLTLASRPYDVALAPVFAAGVDWEAVDPAEYDQLVFVCGPSFSQAHALEALLQRFSHCKRIGLNLSMLEPLEHWNPYTTLIERDSSVTVRPDITFLERRERVPVVGLILVHPQAEYGERACHTVAEKAIRNLIATRSAAIIPIDTRLDRNAGGLRTATEVESVIARMDLVLTTRLHGMVLALKNGVPAVVVDPIAGGGKVWLQAQVIGWPVVYTADKLNFRELLAGFEYCLTDAARREALLCAKRAAGEVEKIKSLFISAVRDA